MSSSFVACDAQEDVPFPYSFWSLGGAKSAASRGISDKSISLPSLEGYALEATAVWKCGNRFIPSKEGRNR